ncbi:hypothetical protein ZWY2020_022476 [Hordeum vulgare]|nr:hypothetical protein ZWY2020_022476 [Hordeum vulgare]
MEWGHGGLLLQLRRSSEAGSSGTVRWCWRCVAALLLAGAGASQRSTWAGGSAVLFRGGIRLGQICAGRRWGGGRSSAGDLVERQAWQESATGDGAVGWLQHRSEAATRVHGQVGRGDALRLGQDGVLASSERSTSSVRCTMLPRKRKGVGGDHGEVPSKKPKCPPSRNRASPTMLLMACKDMPDERKDVIDEMNFRRLRGIKCDHLFSYLS